MGGTGGNPLRTRCGWNQIGFNNSYGLPWVYGADEAGYVKSAIEPITHQNNMSEAAEASSSTSLQVFVKTPTSGKVSVSITPDKTVLELKETIHSSNADIPPPDQQRLIYSGRVLKDEDLISKYGLKTGHTIHLVRAVWASGCCRKTMETKGRSERDKDIEL